MDQDILTLNLQAGAMLALTQKLPVPLSDTVNAAPVLMSVSVLPPVPEVELERARTVSALKQLKELLDAKTINDAEFKILKKKYLEKL